MLCCLPCCYCSAVPGATSTIRFTGAFERRSEQSVYRDTAASDLIQCLTHIGARLHHTLATVAAYIERIYNLKDGLQMTSTPITSGKHRCVSRSLMTHLVVSASLRRSCQEGIYLNCTNCAIRSVQPSKTCGLSSSTLRS